MRTAAIIFGIILYIIAHCFLAVGIWLSPMWIRFIVAGYIFFDFAQELYRPWSEFKRWYFEYCRKKNI